MGLSACYRNSRKAPGTHSAMGDIRPPVSLASMWKVYSHSMQKEVDQAIKTLCVHIKDRHAKALLGWPAKSISCGTSANNPDLKSSSMSAGSAQDTTWISSLGVPPKKACRCIPKPFKP